MTKEQQKIKSLYKKLLASPWHSFPLPGKPLDSTAEHGVYIIYNARGGVVHVGRTLRARNGLNQRLRNHLNAASSFTNIYLHGDGSELRSGYQYKYLVLADPRKRALVEALAIGVLCPKHIGLGD